MGHPRLAHNARVGLDNVHQGTEKGLKQKKRQKDIQRWNDKITKRQKDKKSQGSRKEKGRVQEVQEVQDG